MRVLIIFIRAHPWRSLSVLVALVVAGLAEGIGLTALLPVLTIAFGRESGQADPAHGVGRHVVNALEQLGIHPQVGSLLVAFFALVLLRSALVLLARRQVGNTVARVATDLRLELLRALLASRWEFFVRQPVGKLANAISSEAQRSSGAYLTGATMAASLVQLVVYSTVAALVSWQATLVYLLGALAVSLSLGGLLRMARKAGKKQTKLNFRLLAGLADTVQSVKPLKAMAQEYLADSVLAAHTKALNKAVRKEILAKEGLNAAQYVSFTGMVTLGAWAGFEVLELAPEAVLMLLMLVARVLSNLGKVQSQYQKLLGFESAYWSLRETIDEATRQQEPPAGARTPSLDQAVRLENVHFAYDKTPVLRGLSLEIPARALTVLVGFSGAGKTTVVDLVTGLLRPQGGQVLVDGVSIEDLDLRAWRRMIGYVPQESMLLHDTILHNITLGAPDLGAADAEQALRAAEAWSFVSKLPEGMETVVGERGTRFSGGQRQRMMIARSLVRRPRLLILDEATSNLDPEAEAGICRTLRALRARTTVLAISHQPALVEAADRVYRLEKGRAERSGPQALVDRESL